MYRGLLSLFGGRTDRTYFLSLLAVADLTCLVARYTKTAAPVVDSDQDFAGVLREILVSKNIGSLNLNIELDLDRMGQYRKNQVSILNHILVNR